MDRPAPWGSVCYFTRDVLVLIFQEGVAGEGVKPPMPTLDGSAVASAGAKPPRRTFDPSAVAKVGAKPPSRTLPASREETRIELMKADIVVPLLCLRYGLGRPFGNHLRSVNGDIIPE
jgi:hypothetical protein